MTELVGNARSELIVEIDSGYATEITEASFRQGIEDEIINRFYHWWGNIFMSVENRRTSTTRYFTVEGRDLEVFNAYYPSKDYV